MNKEKKEIIKKEIKYIKNQIKTNKLTLIERIPLYNQLYLKYGNKIYKKYTPYKVKEKDIEFLINDNRFVEFYLKYGEKEFNHQKFLIKSIDMEFETGNKFKSFLYKHTHHFIDNLFKIFLPLATSLSLSLPVYTAVSSEIEQFKTYNSNSDEIEEYLDNIKNYSQQISDYNLTDLENIMKLIYDLWKNIDGYGEPKKDLISCLGLDIAYGQGVCRNIVDDISRKLNYINPEYNAHLIVVDYKNVDTITSIIPFNNPHFRQNNSDATIDKTQKSTTSFVDSYKYPEYIGNHAVILMNIPENNVQLIVDPTNPSIGVYIDGKIHIFNTIIGEDYSLSRDFLGDTLVNGFDGFIYPIEYLDSYDNDCKLSLDELEQLYGKDAQFEALCNIENLTVDWPSIDYIDTTNNSSNENKVTNSFKESLYVSEKDLNSNITTSLNSKENHQKSLER